jgi:hypothetical protein
LQHEKIKEQGVTHPIDYRNTCFAKEVRKYVKLGFIQRFDCWIICQFSITEFNQKVLISSWTLLVGRIQQKDMIYSSILED